MTFLAVLIICAGLVSLGQVSPRNLTQRVAASDKRMKTMPNLLIRPAKPIVHDQAEPALPRSPDKGFQGAIGLFMQDTKNQIGWLPPTIGKCLPAQARIVVDDCGNAIGWIAVAGSATENIPVLDAAGRPATLLAFLPSSVPLIPPPLQMVSASGAPLVSTPLGFVALEEGMTIESTGPKVSISRNSKDSKEHG